MPETHCIVPGCTNTGDHILPKAKDRREAWIQTIKRGKNKYEKWSPPSKYCYICREHFVNDDYISYTYHGTTPSRKTLKRTAVPSVFAWKTPKPENEERASRYASRTAKKRKLLDDITYCVERMENINPDIEVIQTSTDLEDLSVGYCTEIQCENDSISTNDISNFNNDEVGPVKFMSVPTQTLDQQGFTIEDFGNDPQGVHYYTGLEDISKFYFVLQTLGPAAYCLTYIYFQITFISVPDQFFMVLMKLRRHTPNFELSRNFKCSDIAVRNIIITWIKFMALQWQELDMWPSKELVQYFVKDQ